MYAMRVGDIGNVSPPGKVVGKLCGSFSRGKLAAPVVAEGGGDFLEGRPTVVAVAVFLKANRKLSPDNMKLSSEGGGFLGMALALASAAAVSDGGGGFFECRA